MESLDETKKHWRLKSTGDGGVNVKFRHEPPTTSLCKSSGYKLKMRLNCRNLGKHDPIVLFLLVEKTVRVVKIASPSFILPKRFPPI